LHRVEPVSRGVRLAAVGWVRSLIRAADQRELLFDLDRVVLMLRQGQGGDEALDLVLKTRGNLLRRWLDD
jgi:PKHD-type hydroxylase